jgi:ribose 5-phosphate isomerase A
MSRRSRERGASLSAQRDELAEAGIEQIKTGMLVGLGTGRASSRAIRALGKRVKDEGLKIKCVATSEASERLAREMGLEVIDFALVERVDYLFDGADECDHELRMLKGAGGAMTRERIVAWASRRSVYLVQRQKVVETLGTNTTLAIAVMAFGLASIRAALRSLGLHGVCRRTLDGQLHITDNGNLILDVMIDGQDLEELASQLNDIPGVVDHGLFLTEADEIIVENGEKLERMVRTVTAGASA